MYQPPILAHGFNHQSFYRQPVSHLRQMNEIVWNRNNEVQQMDGVISSSFPSIPYQKSVSTHANLEKQIYSSLNDTIKQQIEFKKDSKEVKKHSKKAIINNQDNGLSKDISGANKTDRSSKRQLRITTATSNTNQKRLSRQSSLGAIPATKNILSQDTVPLANSHSAGTIEAYIERERRAHTMAPLTRILGPSSTIKTNIFANVVAPSDSQAMKSSHLTQTMPNRTFNSYSQPAVEMADVIGDNNEEEDDDDDAPIIVKVRYDPDTGGPPSEDIIRQAVDNQLKRQFGQRMTKDPIVLNFLDHTIQPQILQTPIRPQLPSINQHTLPVSQPINNPRLRIPIPPQQQLQQQNFQSLQRQQHQHQQLLQQQQLEQQLKQQRQLQLQQKQEKQRRLQLQQQQQQLKAQQKQQRLQQDFLLQQQDQKQQLEQFLQQQWHLEQQQQQRLQQDFLLQQQDQKQQLEQFLQQQSHLEQQQIQQQQQKYRQQLQLEQQQIKHQLQLEQQQIQQQQQKYRQLLQQQQQQQGLYQRQQQISQQQLYERRQNNPSLPPMGPQPSRTVPSLRPIPMNRPPAMFPQNNNIRPVQTFPLPQIPLRNPQQISTTSTQRLPDQNITSALASNPLPTGFNTYNNYPRKYTPSIFIPITAEMDTEQQSIPINNTNTLNVPQNLLKRPHTAPSSIEKFRPSSALDTPELSKENLYNMLNQIPSLHGRQFNIEYIEPTEPDGYPIPSQLDNNNKYPEPVVVDQLPNNIIQHVRSSGNLALKAALDPIVQPQQNVQSADLSQATASTLNVQSSTVLHHKVQPKQQVKQSRPASSDDSESTTETSSSEEETETETETEVEEIEILPLLKY